MCYKRGREPGNNHPGSLKGRGLKQAHGFWKPKEGASVFGFNSAAPRVIASGLIYVDWSARKRQEDSVVA